MSFLGLIWFRTKVLTVFKNELDYNVATPGHQQDSFNSTTRAAYENGLNEFDAVITFMLIQLGILSRPISENVKWFYIDKLSSLHTLSYKSVMGKKLIELYVKNNKDDFTLEMLSRWELDFVKRILGDEIQKPFLDQSISENKVLTVNDSSRPNQSTNLETKLLELKGLRDKELITEEQFNARTMEILRSV